MIENERQKAIVETLRYVSGTTWPMEGGSDAERHPISEMLREVADVVEREDFADSPCCPVCEEVACDEGCPCYPLRRGQWSHVERYGTKAVAAAIADGCVLDECRHFSVRPLGTGRNGCGALWSEAVSDDATEAVMQMIASDRDEAEQRAWEAEHSLDLIDREATAAADFLDSYSDESELARTFPMVVTIMRVYAARMRAALSGDLADAPNGAHGPESPPVISPARTVEVSDRTGRTDPDVP